MKTRLFIMVMVMICGASFNAFSQAEDCVSLNPNNVRVTGGGSLWRVVDGTHSAFSAPNRAEALRIVAVIRRYGINRSCFVGRPDASFTYLLKNGAAPAGPMAGEDCIGFNPANLSLQPFGTGFRMEEGNHAMFVFPNLSEAATSLWVIAKYGFTQSCYVGRPNASLIYMRK